MNDKPLHEFPPENGGAAGGSPVRRSNLFARLTDSLTHLGLGDTALRIGTNALAVVLVLAVVWLMQFLYRQANLGWTPGQAALNVPTPTSAPSIEALPAEISFAVAGIARQALPHTIVPSRPREDVLIYTVQQGDTLFGIADKFGLKPITLLFGNWETLKDNPDLLKPDQKLNILPVDGMYYQWNATDNLNSVASLYGVDPETIVDYPGNHLDSLTVGDYSHPNIADRAWLILPGGKRDVHNPFEGPATLISMTPNSGVLGAGLCTGITFVKVGTGTFIFPTVEHWLSGTPFTPSIGHYGVDFAGSTGNAVYASDSGTVVFSGWNDWGYGNLVIIDHGNGWETRYAHLSSINVSCGQDVRQGDVVGGVGMTGGTSTGPHLHFEMVNKTYGRVDPLLFLPAQ